MFPVFTQDWFTGREFQLRLWLAPFVNQPVHAVEVGCFEGRSTLWFLNSILIHPDSTLTCIDSFCDGEEYRHAHLDFAAIRRNFEHNLAPHQGRVTLNVGPSREILPSLRHARYSFIYLDGSHRADDVEEDAKLAWPLLAPGGILIFDDYLWETYVGTPNETRLGIDRFIETQWTKLDPLPGYQLAVRKR